MLDGSAISSLESTPGEQPARWPFLALLAAAFCMGFTMPAARLFMAAALLGLLIDVARKKRRWRMPTSAWLWVLLVVLASVVTHCGLNPDKGVRKLTKLLWFFGIPVAASLIDSRAKLWLCLRMLIYGTVVAAVRVTLRNLIGAGAIVARLGEIPAAGEVSFAQELIFQGGLSDGQRLMVGLVGAVAVVMSGDFARTGSRWLRLEAADDMRGARTQRTSLLIPVWPIVIILITFGEIVVLKRGSWLSALAILAPMLARRVRWYWIALGLALLAALTVGITPIRQRVQHLSQEMRVESGGRMAMWTKIAPPLLREYPQGIGYRAMTSELMRERYPRVEPDRDHLHSNFVEMAVSLGWAGLAVYLLWMGAMLTDAWKMAPMSPVFWMLLALFINGIVEYNFGDGAIVVIYALLGGMAAAGRRLADNMS